MRAHAKHLTKGVAIYGAGDAAISVVNFLLLPIYVKFDILTPVDYGALSLIIAAETFAKVLSRWGLDGSFMRFYLERSEGAPRRLMTSTIVWFLVAADGVLLAVALLGSRGLAHALSLDIRYLTALRLMFVNIALMAFTFVPMHSMRMQDQAATYSAFAFARSAGDGAAARAARHRLAVRRHRNVPDGLDPHGDAVGVHVAVVSVAARPGVLVDGAQSYAALRSASPAGGPGVADARQRAQDRARSHLASGAGGVLAAQSELGVYQNGVALGTGVGFFKGALETAWAPFYYATSRQPAPKKCSPRWRPTAWPSSSCSSPARRRRPRRHPPGAEARVPRRAARRAAHRYGHWPAGHLPADVHRPEPHETARNSTRSRRLPPRRCRSGWQRG